MQQQDNRSEVIDVNFQSLTSSRKKEVSSVDINSALATSLQWNHKMSTRDLVEVTNKLMNEDYTNNFREILEEQNIVYKETKYNSFKEKINNKYKERKWYPYGWKKNHLSMVDSPETNKRANQVSQRIGKEKSKDIVPKSKKQESEPSFMIGVGYDFKDKVFYGSYSGVSENEQSGFTTLLNQFMKDSGVKLLTGTKKSHEDFPDTQAGFCAAILIAGKPHVISMSELMARPASVSNKESYKNQDSIESCMFCEKILDNKRDYFIKYDVNTKLAIFLEDLELLRKMDLNSSATKEAYKRYIGMSCYTANTVSVEENEIRNAVKKYLSNDNMHERFVKHTVKLGWEAEYALGQLKSKIAKENNWTQRIVW